MYADTISDSMKEAIEETQRRRSIQEEYNKKHNIVPKTIVKEIREVVSNAGKEEKTETRMTKEERKQLIVKVENEMKEAAKNLDFERAMELRDILYELKSDM